jgi:hypothetical protein
MFLLIIIRVMKSKRMTGQSMWHVWRRREMHRKVWWGSLKEEDHLEYAFLDGRIILK